MKRPAAAHDAYLSKLIDTLELGEQIQKAVITIEAGKLIEVAVTRYVMHDEMETFVKYLELNPPTEVKE